VNGGNANAGRISLGLDRFQARRKGSYGIDAPYWLPIAAVLIVADVVVGVVSGTATPFVIAPIMLASLGQVAFLPGTYLGAPPFGSDG
jgi:hypothetical protein